MTKRVLLLCGVLACLGVTGPGAVPGDSPSSPPAESRTVIGPYGGDIRGLDANPANPKEIYAVSYNKGQVFKSLNSGMTWTSLAAFDSELFDIAVSPSDPDIVYALGKEGLFKSSDKGATWKEYEFGTRRYSTGQIAVHPKNPDEVFVAGHYQPDPSRSWITCPAFLKSQNGGKTWTMTKIYTQCKAGELTCLALSKNHPAVLFAAGYRRDTQWKYHYFISRSSDGGKTWKDVSPVMSGSPCDAAVDPGNPNRVFLAANKTIWRSSNGGTNWAATNLQPLTALAIDPAQSQVLYAGGPGSIFRSLDGGLHWAQFQGIGGSAQDFLAGSSRVLAATSTGIFKSDNNGSSWKASHQNLCAMNVTTLAVAPSSPQVLYAGIPVFGLYRSANGGKSWLRKGVSLACGSVVKLAVYPDNPDWLFASVVG